MQEQAQIQQQVAAKRAEIEEQRGLLQQQAQVRELELEQIVEQGQLESTCEFAVGDNLVQKMQVSIVVRDGVVQAIEEASICSRQLTRKLPDLPSRRRFWQPTTSSCLPSAPP